MLELMVVVAVVAILARVAYPAYADHVLRGRLVDATNALASMQARLEQHYQDNRTYLTTTAATSPCASSSTVKTFTITCPDLTASTYKIQAVGSGTTAGFTYTVTHLDARTSTVSSAWGGASYTCWIQKRGDTCATS